MRQSRSLILTAFIVTNSGLWAPPSPAQETASNNQIEPAITGSGQLNHIAVWKSSTTLGSSTIYATGGNVGIGTTAPAAKLEVNGGVNVDGNLSLSGSIFLSGVGPVIQAPNNGLSNFGAGLGALSATVSGLNNTAIGDGALAIITSGIDNTANGAFALTNNTTGIYNTANGSYALYTNTAGNGNTASGYSALYSNTTGLLNTAMGSNALVSNTTGQANAAFGVSALYYNTTGLSNTAAGPSALGFNTTGIYNTAVGSAALFSNVGGGYNIGIGNNAGYFITASNNIDIANQGSASDSGVVRIGTAGTQTSAFVAGIYGVPTGNNNAVPVVIDSNGQLGTISSSRRYKEEIQDMGDASSGLMRLRPVTFRYKKAFDDGSKPLQYGLIAEEVAKVYPDLVSRSADGQIETVKYEVLDSMLMNELQKQSATISAQEKQIRSLEERLVRIEATFIGAETTSSY